MKKSYRARDIRKPSYREVRKGGNLYIQKTRYTSRGKKRRLMRIA